MPRLPSRTQSCLSALVLVALLLVLPAPAAAGAASAAGSAWRGEYFASPDLSGSPALVRSDANLNYNWGWGAPDRKLPADHFSARWTRNVSLAAGTYRFNVSVDDGVRLYVDGQALIDQWRITAPITYTASLNLAAGTHLLKVEYYENTERAQIRVWWEKGTAAPVVTVAAPWQPPAVLGAWQGDYFDNKSLEGDPDFERDDAFVYFYWSDAGPGGGFDDTDFSVRWTRVVDFAGGTYRFKVTADDGVRVWFDWATIIDAWREGSAQTYTVEKEIKGGTHDIVVEYFQAGGDALVKLEWEDTSVDWVGNLSTCMPPENAWVKIYRLAPNKAWEDLKNEGYGPTAQNGELMLFGLPVSAIYSWDGQPYKLELWKNGQLARTEGDVLAGQRPLLLQPGGLIRTSWPCGG
jgi:hypothetical protein